MTFLPANSEIDFLAITDMVSSMVLRKLVSVNLLPRTLTVVRPGSVSPSARFFTTNSAREYFADSDSDEPESDSDRQSGLSLSGRRGDFLAARIPFLMENPFFLASPGVRSGIYSGFNVDETDDALNFRIDMPGLGKEDVKLNVEQNIVVIKGEGPKESEDEEGRKYSHSLDLPEKIFKLKKIKAEMKNGVLKLVVPKVKEEERSDVFDRGAAAVKN